MPKQRNQRERVQSKLSQIFKLKFPLCIKSLSLTGLGRARGIFNSQILKITLTSLIAALACVGIIYAATTIGTNISTDGNLTVSGNATTTGNLNISGALSVTGTSTLGVITSGIWQGTTIGVGYGGTGTSTAFTTGSVIFSGSSGIYSQDNANLYWDDSNNYFGIGTSTPAVKLEVAGTSDATQFIVRANATQSNTNPLVKFLSSIGTELLRIHSDNTNNLFVGTNTGRVNNVSGTGQEGLNNVFLGYNSGYSNTTGWHNVFIGWSAGESNTTDYHNTFIGERAGRTNTGYNNTFIGAHAGYSNTGDGNLAIGYWAGDSAMSGSNNIIIGYNIDIQNAANSNTMTIGNLIFGTGIDGTGTTISSGNIGIGTSTPARALHISDTMRLEPRATAPTSPASGDIYVDSTPTPDELCFYDGSAWQGISSGTDANCQ